VLGIPSLNIKNKREINMKTITERALFERAKRYFEKEESMLKKHRYGTRDILMGGSLYTYIVEPRNNTIDNYWDWSSFVTMCREVGILKKFEEVS
jgi:hypothetical protein